MSQGVITTVVAKYHSQGSHATIHLIHLGTIVPFPKFHILLLFLIISLKIYKIILTKQGRNKGIISEKTISSPEQHFYQRK
jgi:hypothetical protein